MATILEKQYTKMDSGADILKAIRTLAEDKNGRLLLKEHCEWQETKLGEIARLAKILQAKEG